MSASKFDVHCPQCRAKLAVPAAALGKSGKCPHCQHVFPLAMPAPREAAPASAFAPPSPLTPLAPAPYAAGGLTPLGSSDLMPLSDAGLASLPVQASLLPPSGSNPFGDPMPQGDYTLQPMASSPYVPVTTGSISSSIASDQLAQANASYEEAKGRKYYSNDGDGWGLNAGIGGGALMMLLAVVWFCLVFFGTNGHRIPLYPPIMFVIGLIAFFKGIADNFSE